MGLFGDRVHVVSMEHERASAEAQAALAEAGLEVIGVRTIEPSLEDVFISVLAEKKSSTAEDHGLNMSKADGHRSVIV